MNTMTRGEKIDMFIENVKRVTVTSLLILWAIVTMALGIAYGMEHRKSEMLEKELTKIENMYNQYSDAEAIYVYRR